MFEILTNRAVIHISGADSQKFLQSLVTNNIANKIYTYNYLLNSQGRYLYDFFVYQDSIESYFLDVGKITIASLIKRLSMYKLRSNLKIQDVSELYRILYSRSKIEDTIFSLRDPRYAGLGFRSLIKIEDINILQSEVSDLYFKDKYNFSIVDGENDLIAEKSIPIEFGAEELNAIDYKKGCYIGQEVISRAKYQGVVRKKIFKLQFDTNVIPMEQGAEITDPNGNKIGALCSFYKDVAIGLLQEEQYLGLSEKKSMIKGYVADLVAPPWMRS